MKPAPRPPRPLTWTADSVWATPITDQAGNRRLMKGYLDTGSGHATTIAVAGLPSGPYDVYVYADGDNGSASRTGAYQLSGTGITTTSVNLTDAASTNFNATFTQASNSSGNYVKFSVTATGFTLTATPGTASDNVRRAPVSGIQIVPAGPPAPNFTIAAAPSSRTVTQGSPASYTVTVGAVNGFAGTVNLGVSGLPTNATATFTPASIAGAGSATLDVTTATDTPTGSPTLTITGTSGSLTHTATVTLAVTDFTVTAAPSSRTVTPAGSTTYSVAVGALNGFAGSVNLAVTGGLPNGASATFNPTSITGAGTSTLTVTTTASTPAGSSTLTIAGTSGSLTRTTTTTLVVSTTPPADQQHPEYQFRGWRHEMMAATGDGGHRGKSQLGTTRPAPAAPPLAPGR